MNSCPCGSGRALADCCDPIITGRAQAPTAEALMRARYVAYATNRIDFIEKTHAPESREGFDRAASEKWARESEWKGLRIVATKGGTERDVEGVVSFVAEWEQGGKAHRHEEISLFRKDKGAWMFLEGHTPKPETVVKTGPDLGRNDPCHCGSGKKFKKCHAASTKY
ncbi:MAG: YchJ family protein [Elusimicrobia bacterium]|nr:YchJ family protein [Elusimicrobiota bacterium]